MTGAGCGFGFGLSYIIGIAIIVHNAMTGAGCGFGFSLSYIIIEYWLMPGAGFGFS